MLRIAKKINGNSKANPSSNIHKRANRKLDFVAETMQKAFGERAIAVESTFFEKNLFLTGFAYLDQLKLTYRHENRLMVISYNLELSSEVKTTEEFREIGDCVFEVEIRGVLRVKNVGWVCKTSNLEPEEEARYLERLNNPLIMDRMRALDLNTVRVEHQDSSGFWRISCGSMLGSSTWILIPPMLQLIDPKREECVKMAEFFDLVAFAVIHNEPEEP